MENALGIYCLSVTFCLLNILLVPHSTASSVPVDAIIFPGLDNRVYSRPGDLNIGAIMMLTTVTDEMGCSNKIYPNSWNIEFSESVAFAVEVVNNDTKLLPNIKLGFYVVDDCSDPKVSLAQSLIFLPRDESTCSAEICNQTSPSRDTYPLSSIYSSEPIAHYDVMGILAPILSTAAVSVSYLLSVAKVPLIGYTTTSDEFNDKNLHPYFLRVVTPNKYQAIAMLEFISSYGWSYISVVYSEGTYGERAFETIKSSVGSYNICIANSFRVGNDDDMVPIATQLIQFSLARTVILFADEQPVRNLFAAIESMNATGQFIWICCDSVTNASKEKFRPYMKSIIGAFLFIYSTANVSAFYDYIRRQDVEDPTNPWFKSSWENTAHCSIANKTCNLKTDITKLAGFEYSPSPSLAMDAVLTFAHGAHLLTQDLCPNATGVSLRNCVKRDLLLDYLYKVSFKGYTGDIKFDRTQDFQGTYFINQMTYDYVEVRPDEENGTVTYIKDLTQKRVAFYDVALDVLNYTSNAITWDHLAKRDRIVPLQQSALKSEVPESVCSRPCVSGEYKTLKELPCCWDCRKCRDNERLVHGATSCKACDEFTWPDPATSFTTCTPIPLTYLQPSDTVAVILICMAIIAISGCFVVIATYIYYHETRIIKAASRELSLLKLGGIFVGYITVICFQMKPTSTMCSALYFMFCLSFAWLYSPLLVKAIRIYRIFQSGSKNNKRPRFVSPMSQVFLSFVIILSQVILCLVMFIIYKPTAKKTQAVSTEKFVELSCDLTLPGLASFLVYNLILVSACAIFAFKTRKLPDNFNESRFISMCIYTTMVIWLAFIPTYFTAGQEYLRGVLLSVALLLNHTAAVLFLFLPKVYACIFVDQDEIVINRFQTRGTTLDVSGSNNRVGVAPSAPANGTPK